MNKYRRANIENANLRSYEITQKKISFLRSVYNEFKSHYPLFQIAASIAIAYAGIQVSSQSLKQQELSQKFAEYNSLASFIPLMADKNPKVAAAAWQVYNAQEKDKARASIVQEWIGNSIETGSTPKLVEAKGRIDRLEFQKFNGSFYSVLDSMKVITGSTKWGTEIYLLPKDPEIWKDRYSNVELSPERDDLTWREREEKVLSIEKGDLLFASMKALLLEKQGWSFTLLSTPKEFKEIKEEIFQGEPYLSLTEVPFKTELAGSKNVLCGEIKINGKSLAASETIPELGDLSKLRLQPSPVKYFSHFTYDVWNKGIGRIFSFDEVYAKTCHLEKAQ